MAQTTTAVNACDVSFWIDNAAGTITDVSGSSNSLKVTLEREIGELRTFQAKWPVRSGCGKDMKLDYVAVYSTSATEAAQMLLAWWFTTSPEDRTFKLYVPTKNVGSNYFTGQIVIENLEWDNDPTKPEPIALKATFLAHGTISHSIAAT
jgi:hypothetical protein